MSLPMNMPLSARPGLRMPIHVMSLALGLTLAAIQITLGWAQSNPPSTPENLQRDRLVAWCIVPFDSQKRTPEQRAEMLQKLGIRRLAYDYRAEHIPTFDEEMKQLKSHQIELTAWWFPTTLNDEAKKILEVLERHKIQTQLWVTGGGTTPATPEETRRRIQEETNRIRPIAEAAAKIGCKVGLYNHGGWFGEPENQLLILEELKMPNVGIVYNLHHGHDQLARFPELLKKMKPHLLALNLNGMIPGGDKSGNKIVPIGAGDDDPAWLKAILESDYRGPIGILNHTDHDAELRLLDNLDGLQWLLRKASLSTSPTQPSPSYRTWKPVNPPHGTSTQISNFDETVRSLAQSAKEQGEPSKGVTAFASPKMACLSCHQIGKQGGQVGPDLTSIGTQRSAEHLAQSLLQPNAHVEEKYQVVQALLDSGDIVRGFRVLEDAKQLKLHDPSKKLEVTLAKDEIVKLQSAPSLMPEGLMAGLSLQERADLVAFLMDLGHSKRFRPELIASVLEHAQPHEAATFPFERTPLDIAAWPNWEAPVNRDRLYDFYTKEALHFKNIENPPRLMAEFPGLDTGKYGHWGNQDEASWANGDWNKTQLSSAQCGVYHGPDGQMVPRAVCLSLGDSGELSACFNPETLCYEALWKDGFLQFSDVRHGFMNGLIPKGTPLPRPVGKKPEKPFTYHGFYRVGPRIVFAYRIGDEEWLDSPWVVNGEFQRMVGPLEKHPMKDAVHQGSAQWPQIIETEIRRGDRQPYALDTIELPHDNPWNALIFCGDHDFLPDGSLLLCTMQGDVWHGSNLGGDKARWKRFAAGLHQALGLKVSPDGIFVLGRDQITLLHDRNGDQEADFYQSFSTAYETSPAGHDFICGLQRDAHGNFYTASGNQGLVKISRDGKYATIMAEGMRNPDGLGIYPDGVVTVPCSEGNWTPSSMICAVRTSSTPAPNAIPFMGYRGPRLRNSAIVRPELPLVYLPRGLDNSSGGQVYVDSDRWGPLQGQMVHLSFGAGTHFLLLRDEVQGQLQGAVMPLEGDFLSGVHRGRFSPNDGQLYVSGMGGWGTYTVRKGCLQRVRYTGGKHVFPIGFHVHQNGVLIRCSDPVQAEQIQKAKHFAQAWNYRYSAAYGSKEYSTLHRSLRGHDRLEIRAVHVLEDAKTLFVEIPDLQPCNQLHLHLDVGNTKPIDLFATCNRLDEPFVKFAGYMPIAKQILAHPIEADVHLAAKRTPNPWEKKIDGARNLRIEAGSNLTFKNPRLTAKAGETLKLTLRNPDVVPHNWALVRPGKLQKVGEESNKLVGDPEAVIRQYVPQTDDVVCYTDIVEPGEEFSIYFKVPSEPGKYPFLCTFPGHWMVMNGEMVVE